MGLLSRLFGAGSEDTSKRSYEDRLKSEVTQLKERNVSVEPAGPQVSPWGDGGAPLLEQSETSEAPQAETPPTIDPFRDSSGQKVIPEIGFEQVEPKLSGNREKLEVWATIHNQSQFEIEVKDVEMIKQRMMPGRYLKPGEKFEILIFRGDTPKTDDYDDLVVRYRLTGNGDYFESRQFIEYDYDEPYYIPTEIEQDRPVRDI